MAHLIKITLLLSLSINFLNGIIKAKDSNDVYSVAIVLHHKIVHLAGEKNINPKYIKPPSSYNKSPRHVFQKTLEVLEKINKYRKNTNLGEVNVPTYPSKNITSEDVYFQITRLNKELDILLNHVFCPHIEQLSKRVIYKNKTSNDNYFILWSASLAMDELLGRGFSPTDNYEQSLLIIDIVDFLRTSQNIYEDVPKPKKKNRKHPNHVLYATNQLLSKIAKVEKNLWIEPVDVPENPQRIITPTEVYDSLQTVVTELKRIRRRLGIERFYEAPNIETTKTPSDVLQNIEYAIELFPDFKISKELRQYDKKALQKTNNELYAFSMFILNKVNYLKNHKGIKLEPKSVPYIHNLTSMHVYQKTIETMEKINKTRIVNGLYYVATPLIPAKTKNTNDIFDMLLMIDDEITIIMQKNKIKNIQKWNYLVDKKQFINKNNSDIFHNLWKITSLLDILRGDEYTSNETYILAKKLEKRVLNIYNHLTRKKLKIKEKKFLNKQPSDVFELSIKTYKMLIKVLKRANISGGTVVIPKSKAISSDVVYNALRVINTSLIDINIHFDIDINIKDIKNKNTTKTASDVYSVMLNVYKITNLLLEDNSYED